MSDFSAEQKRYLEGLASGLAASRAARGLELLPAPAGGGASAPCGPDAAHLAAMARAEAEGKKLSDPEKWKREEHPFDAYARLEAQCLKGEFPKPADNFRWRFYGLFYVAPAQNSYMCRLRLPNGLLTHWQLQGLARAAANWGGGYAHVTTRANLQIREIAPVNALKVIEALHDLGIVTRGAGADNIRNVTGTPTAGIDPFELLDTRPFARRWHFHVLHDRSLSGLPRKFNVAFDGGGMIAALEETNDIGFQAVEVVDGAGEDVAPSVASQTADVAPLQAETARESAPQTKNCEGLAAETAETYREGRNARVYFRLLLGGITGHKDFARDTGIILKPEDSTRVADAIVRVFIEHGCRTDRTKARLKYLLDEWGFEKFLAAVEAKLAFKLMRAAPERIRPRPAPDRLAHLGVHPQKQKGLNWIGLALPAGRLNTEQMTALAALARDLGDGDIRLTVWQNLLISGVADGSVTEALARIGAMGLSADPAPIRAGLIACTGNTGCKFAAANTKDMAELIARHVGGRLALDQPVNIHITGCPNSCAQHYIGDIGLLGTKIASGGDEDPVEGFHVYVGGGTGTNARTGREFARDVKSEDCPALIEGLLRAWLEHRASAGEPFFAFANRHAIETLRSLSGRPQP